MRRQLLNALAGRQLKAEKRKELERRVEQELLEESLVIERAALMASELNQDGSPPKEWIERYGEENARRIAKVAGDAMNPGKTAPVYLEHARTLTIAIQRAQASRSDASRVAVNVQVIVGEQKNDYKQIVVNKTEEPEQPNE